MRFWPVYEERHLGKVVGEERMGEVMGTISIDWREVDPRQSGGIIAQMFWFHKTRRKILT